MDKTEMYNVTITLSTDGHCIETAAKIELRKLTDRLLQSCSDSIDRETERKIELLQQFLRNTDFNALRASDDRLAGLTPALCNLTWDEGQHPLLTIQG